MMLRKLLSIMIVLAVTAILVSPGVDGDEAIHHHPHHHHFGLLLNESAPMTDNLIKNTAFAIQPSESTFAQTPASALRC